MNRLQDRVAIVTGGATGIGEAICKKFAKEGARVVVVGFAEDPVEEVTEEIRRAGGDVVAFSSVVSAEANAKRCVATAVDRWGKLDVLINNAGTFPEMKETDQFPIDAFDYMLKNNIRAPF